MGRPKKNKEVELTKEQQDRKALLDYINETFEPPINFAMIAKQLKNIMAEYPDYTYNGIKYCLWYMNKEGYEMNTLGLVPYIYNEAKQYYEWRRDMKKTISQWRQNENEVVVSKSRDRKEDIFV